MLTARGWGLLGAGVVLVALTVLTGAGELLVLAVPALVLPVLAVLWCRVPFRIGVKRAVEPPAVVRGEPCVGALAVTNLGARRSPAVTVTDRRGDVETELAVPRLASGQTLPLTYLLPTDRRGVFPLGPLRAQRGDAFGLARAVADLGGATGYAVLPRHHHLDDPPGGPRDSPDGAPARIPFGRSVFAGLREYVPGDDHRSIHWLSTARAGELQVRVYRDSSQPVLAVLLDDRASRYTGDRFEDAVEVAASLADLADRFELPLMIVTTGGRRCGSPGERPERLELMHFLAGVTARGDDETEADGDGGPAFDPTRHPRDATVVVVGGGFTGPDEDGLTMLRRAVGRVTVVAVVPEGTPEPDVPTLQIGDGAELPLRWGVPA